MVIMLQTAGGWRKPTEASIYALKILKKVMHLISTCWDFPCLDDHTRCLYINNREQLIKFIWIDNGLTNRHDVTSKNACCKDCQGMLRERVKKKMEIVIPTFLRLHLSFLCASLSAFYTRMKKKTTQIDYVLRPTLENWVFKAWWISTHDLCQRHHTDWY